MPRPYRRPDPMLLGQPSPSLSKINRMNIAELEVRIERLRTESARITKRINNLKRERPVPQNRIDQLTVEIKRLGLLRRAAEKRLEAKLKRRAEHLKKS